MSSGSQAGSSTQIASMQRALPDAAAPLNNLRRDGYVVAQNLVPAQTVDALRADLDDRFTNTPFCDGAFYGARTKRFGALLRRSEYAATFVMDPLVVSIAEAVLGPFADTIQLNLTQALALHPGQGAQPPHRDQDMWGGAKGGMEYLVNVMWPFTPYTTENGATLVWPGSHLRQHESAADLGDPVSVTVAPGSALIFLGSTLHAGGANRSMGVREGMIISYCLGWLKPYENQWLAYPPDVARRFEPALARLVGYAIHRPNLGNVEGQCPTVLFHGTMDEHFAATDALTEAQLRLLAERNSAPSSQAPLVAGSA